MVLSRSRERLIARLLRRKTREREGRVLAEGVRVVREALDAGVDVDFALVSPRAYELGAATLVDRLRSTAVDVVEVDHAAMAPLSGTETPQGLLLVCRQPRVHLDALIVPDARLLVLDAIQDPGNAGTLIRTAAAFGLSGVVALDGTVDAWNAKTVRAAAGTCFRLPIVSVPWATASTRLGGADCALWVADAAGESARSNVRQRPWALVVGSEGSGARSEVRAAATGMVSVPMPGGTESLNVGVAGAILMFAFTREDDAS